MIYIKSLRLKNFGRHSLVESDFAGHVIGLTGPNGRGKSTILQALQFALTGTIDTYPSQPLRNFIKREAGDNTPKHAEVEVTFVADGKEGKIVRRITGKTSSRKLWWDGAAKPVTAEKKVSEILEEILGVDKKAINSTVFIRQGEMDSMFGAEGDRRDFYTRLLMLGHLSGIANIIENHRSNQAATVQDLGPVMGAATTAYEEAFSYFDEVDTALQGKPSEEMRLAAARRVVAIFEDVAEVEQAKSNAGATLRGIAPAAGDTNDISEWVARQQQEIDKTSGELAKIHEIQNRNSKCNETWTSALRRSEALSTAAKVFVDLEALEVRYAEVSDTGEDPSEEILKLKANLDKYRDRDRLEMDIPRKEELLPELMKASEVAEIEHQRCKGLYDTVTELYVTKKSSRDLRKSLLDSIGHDHKPFEECPMCYGSEAPDKDRLTADWQEDEVRLTELAAEGKQARLALDDASAKHQTSLRDFSGASQELQELKKDLQRLNLELALSNRDKNTASLKELEKRQEVYREAEFRKKDLANQVSAAKEQTVGKTKPSDTDLAEALLEFQAAEEELAACPWTDENAAEKQKVSLQLDSQRAVFDKIHNAVASLENSQQRYDALVGELKSVLEELPKGFYSEVTDGAENVKESEAAQFVSILEGRQSEHDELRGKKEAANESLKAASRKITELEMRKAEQGHRSKLVADLESLRDAFKPQGATLEYLNYRFGEIARMAGDYLAEGDADFMVSPSEKIPLCFEFIRTDREDEVWLPQDRLSGGQKVRLAVATLRAIHALVMPDVGLMVLDEPTTHLDTDTKRSMATMLERIGDEGTLQMVVCDHSQVLVDAFSDTIEIPA